MFKQKTSYFFDLDDTLWDFHGNSKIVLEQLHRQVFDEHLPFSLFYDTYIPVNNRLWGDYRNGNIEVERLKYERFYQTLRILGIDDLKLAQWFSKTYLDELPNQTQLFPKTIFTLKALKQRNKTIAILTNGFTEVQHYKLKNSVLSSYIDAVFTSEELGVAKPNSLYFSTVLKTLDIQAEEAVMIGDSIESDIKGALNSGIEAVWFNPHKQPLPNDLDVREIGCLEDVVEMD